MDKQINNMELIGDLLWTLEYELAIAIEKHKKEIAEGGTFFKYEENVKTWNRLLNYKEFIMNRLIERDTTLTLPEYMKALNHMNEVHEDFPPDAFPSSSNGGYFEIKLKWYLNDKGFKRGRKINDIC